MKAHVKTEEEQNRENEKCEIVRFLKILTFVLLQDLEFDPQKVKIIIESANQYSEELFHDPEKWGQLDDYLIDKGINIYPKEDINERLEASRDIHKKAGKKWRKY